MQEQTNPYLLVAEQLRQRAAETGESYTTPDPLAEVGMGKEIYDCPQCGNTGTLLRHDENGLLWARECDCMKTRRSIRRIRKSGLEDALKRYSFQSYETPDEKRKVVKETAARFCDVTTGWFFIAGQSGSGKSHICTAICGELLERQEVRYMLWRDEAVQLKANANKPEYSAMIQPLKDVPVLYIDDFLKGRITEPDLNLAFELINARYNDRRKRTIISSERRMEELMKLDEAMAGRIYERSRGFMVQPPDENWRLR